MLEVLFQKKTGDEVSFALQVCLIATAHHTFQKSLWRILRTTSKKVEHQGFLGGRGTDFISKYLFAFKLPVDRNCWRSNFATRSAPRSTA